MSNATEIQAQLAEAWENAERVAPQEGDTYIGRHGGREKHYSIGVSSGRLAPSLYRVLERAKPKRPHVVMAGMLCRGDDELREPFIEREDGRWESIDALGPADDLIDPVPLVEVPTLAELDGMAARLGRENDWEWPGTMTIAHAVLELLRGER